VLSPVLTLVLTPVLRTVLTPVLSFYQVTQWIDLNLRGFTYLRYISYFQRRRLL